VNCARLFSLRHAVVVISLTLCSSIGSPINAQGRVLLPDSPTTAPIYRRDSLAMRLQAESFGGLEVIAERRLSNPAIASGKYFVRLNGHVIAVSDNPSLILGAPHLAAFYLGDPTIVLLSTYTGGTGATAIPSYFIKIILLGHAAGGGAVAHAYSLGGSEHVSTDRFHLVNGPAHGEFTMASDKYRLIYSRGVLRLEGGTSFSTSSAPSAVQKTAYTAAMRVDLRRLATAEEAFFAASGKYTTKIGPGGLDYAVSAGNTLSRISLTSDGWQAVIGNARTRGTCSIFVGSTPQSPATEVGQPSCKMQ
jgi:hypothetical protein